MALREVDFLIVGQGLAGSLLAFELIERGQAVLVLDNHHQGSSSQVAAGIINPITGHRLNLTEGFVSYWSQAKDSYRKLESIISAKVLREIEQHRLIKNSGQANYFAKRQIENQYADFLATVEQSQFCDSPYGVAQVKQTAAVDSRTLLNGVQAWLKGLDSYHSEKLDYQSLIFGDSEISLNQVRAKRVIFCEGYQAINNPWLKELPFKLAKGEVLTLEQRGSSATMLSWGNWYVPQNNGEAKLGSNYAWDDLSLSPTEGVREKLLGNLNDYTQIHSKVIDHSVGIRPTTKHRRPFVGPISGLKNAYCFNGFGSKGCLTIPQHAIDLCDFLLNNKPLSHEVTKWL